MQWLRTIAREILGLFVDDGSFAIAILVWLILVVHGLAQVAGPSHWLGPDLFGGLAAVLVVSVLRFARRSN